MSITNQAWDQSFGSQTASGTLFNTYTTAKTVINQQSLIGIPANSMKVGDTFSITASGGISNIVTTPGTIVFQIMMGSIVAWTSGNVQLNTTAHTTLPFILKVDCTVQLVNTTVNGAVAKILGIGLLNGVMFTKTAGQAESSLSDTTIVVPVTAPAQGTAFDSTISQILDFWVGFSISNSGNGVQIHQYRMQSNS